MSDDPFAELLAHHERFSAWLQSTIGLSERFLDALDRDDDWTFIIKLHSMLEAGLNHLLIERLGEPKLSKPISELNTSDLKRGKLAFVRAFGLLSDDSTLFIRELSEIRNKLVHDVKHFDFSIKGHAEKLDEKQRKNWYKYLSTGLPEHEYIDGRFVGKQEVIDADPRHAIRQCCFVIMGRILHYQP